MVCRKGGKKAGHAIVRPCKKSPEQEEIMNPQGRTSDGQY